jgi:hypothetical protein
LTFSADLPFLLPRTQIVFLGGLFIVISLLPVVYFSSDLVLLLIMLVGLLNLRRHDCGTFGLVSILTGRGYFKLSVRFYFHKGPFGLYSPPSRRFRQ